MKNTAKSSGFVAVDSIIDIYLVLQLCTKTLERGNVL
jgi:hypothetical protein